MLVVSATFSITKGIQSTWERPGHDDSHVRRDLFVPRHYVSGVVGIHRGYFTRHLDSTPGNTSQESEALRSVPSVRLYLLTYGNV
jgi:hypothetical protein